MLPSNFEGIVDYNTFSLFESFPDLISNYLVIVSIQEAYQLRVPDLLKYVKEKPQLVPKMSRVHYLTL